MSNNIYDIMKKLNAVSEQDVAPPVSKQGATLLESTMKEVLNEKYMGFDKTVAAIKKGGSAKDPEAVAASIGRKKYGKEKFQAAAAKGKKLSERTWTDPETGEFHGSLASTLQPNTPQSSAPSLQQQMADQAARRRQSTQQPAAQSNQFQINPGAIQQMTDQSRLQQQMADQAARRRQSTQQPAAQQNQYQVGQDALQQLKDQAARRRQSMGLQPKQESETFNEDDMEEGNKFTGNLAKARAAGKKRADLDGDGDMETVREGAKPDYIDLDKDGNRKESMKKAAADKKKRGVAEGSDSNTKSYLDAFKSETDNMKPGTKKYVGRKDGKEVYAKKDAQGNVKFYHRDGIKGPLKGVAEAKADPTSTWVVSYTAERKSYDEKPSSVTDEETIVAASSKEEAIAKVKKMSKVGTNMYGFSARPARKSDGLDSDDIAEQRVTEGFKNTYNVGDRVDSPLGTGTIVAVSKNVNVDGRVKVKLDDPSKAGEDGKYKDSFVLNTTQLKHIDEQGVAEGTKETSTGRIHKAEPGGYGRKDDEDEDKDKDKKKDKKAEPAVKRGRGRPKKDADSDTGEVKKWDTDTLQRWIVGSVPKKLPGKASVKHKIKDEPDEKLDEVAPPGAKAERMVKHIKKGYAKDGKVTPKEKGIAYATAWKAKKAGKVEESIPPGFPRELAKRIYEHYDGDMNSTLTAMWNVHNTVMESKSVQSKKKLSEGMSFEQSTTKPAMGTYKGGVWTADPPKKGEVGVPVPSPDEGAPVSSPSKKRPAPKATKEDVSENKELSDVLKLAGMVGESVKVDECGMNPVSGAYGDTMQDTEGRMNISTNMSTDGNKTVTITADGDAAVDLMKMLKLAGINSDGGEDTDVEKMSEEKDDRYEANTTPEEEVLPVQTQLKGGNGEVAGKEKKMTPHGYKFADNPLAMKESMSLKLMKEYESIKKTK